MASIVRPSGLPRYCPGISFDMEEDVVFLRKYLGLADSCSPDERYDPEEVPKRAVIHRGNPKTIPDFVAISGRMALSPEARALIEEFEPGVHRFLPVEIVRAHGTQPIYRLDGRVLDEPYYLFIPQVWLDAVWVERSEVRTAPTWWCVGSRLVQGPELVYPQLGGRGRIVLRRELTEGRHLWRGGYHLPGRVFFSDALVRAAEARKLRKLECEHLEEA